jgi:peptidoglycan/xylan/chitin deacetylase (PgdA/CDA1 family)
VDTSWWVAIQNKEDMKTIVIHEVKKEFFNTPLEKYNLTFDDGLYSQYYYWPLIKKIKTHKIFFIATNLIGNGPKRQQFDGDYKEFLSCYESLATFRKSGNNKNYMRLSELKSMAKDGAALGGHGHNHIQHYEGSLFNQVNVMRKDIESMISWFKENLGFIPKDYAYPHYEDPLFLKILLNGYYGFERLHGRERIEIEKEENIFSHV